MKIELRRKKINEIVKISREVLPIMVYKGRLRPKQGTFFRFQVYKRVGISQIEVYERVYKSSFICFKGLLINTFQTDAPYGCIISFIMHYRKMTRRLPFSTIYS